MKVMERCSQEILGSWEEVQAVENEYDALETKMGNVPAKRRYWAGYGTQIVGTMVWEREWESMAAMEAYMDKVSADPEWNSMGDKSKKIFGKAHWELFGCW